MNRRRTTLIISSLALLVTAGEHSAMGLGGSTARRLKQRLRRIVSHFKPGLSQEKANPKTLSSDPPKRSEIEEFNAKVTAIPKERLVYGLPPANKFPMDNAAKEFTANVVRQWSRDLEARGIKVHWRTTSQLRKKLDRLMKEGPTGRQSVPEAIDELKTNAYRTQVFRDGLLDFHSIHPKLAENASEFVERARRALINTLKGHSAEDGRITKDSRVSSIMDELEPTLPHDEFKLLWKKWKNEHLGDPEIQVQLKKIQSDAEANAFRLVSKRFGDPSVPPNDTLR